MGRGYHSHEYQYGSAHSNIIPNLFLFYVPCSYFSSIALCHIPNHGLFENIIGRFDLMSIIYIAFLHLVFV